MFPYFTGDGRDMVAQGILALVRRILEANGVEAALVSEIIGLRAFAGALFTEVSGYAQGFAIVVDDLLDLALQAVGLSGQVRGDH